MPSEFIPRFRSAGKLLLVLATIAMLGACGGGYGTSAGTPAGSGTGATPSPTSPGGSGGSGGTTVGTTPDCTVAPAQFTNIVWPEMASSCMNCHAAGRVAGGTRLLFIPGGDAQQNYTALQTFVQTTGDVVLSKSIGQLNHGGGAPYGDATSQSYKDLQTLLPTLEKTCSALSTSIKATGFWAGVQFASSSTTLARASVLFAGRNPTPAESAAAAAGGDALRQTIRGYMQGAAFDNFLNEAGMTQFLTLRVSPLGANGLSSTDFPALANIAPADMNRFNSAVQREPIELMKYIVNGDRPWTDMVQGKYTVANGILAQYLGANVPGSFANPANDNEWRPATIPALIGGVREHAGVLSSHAWLASFPTTATNRNRHRIFALANQFLATDVAALAVRPIGGPGNFIIPTVENPGCAACHNTIDPMAAGFQNWAEDNRFLPNSAAGKPNALPYSYMSSSYPKNAAGMAFYVRGDNWFRDEKAPGYANTPMPGGVTGNNTALQWLGQQLAADPRFGLGAVEFWYQAVFGRAPLKAPIDSSGPNGASQLAAFNAQQAEFDSIAARFTAGGYKVKDLLVDLVMSQWFNANGATDLSGSRAADLADVGSYNLLIPSQLNLKLGSVAGQAWNQFSSPYSGLALTYGTFDANTSIVRAKSYTMMQALTIDRFAATSSCAIAKADFDKPAASRLLFTTVTLADTPVTNPDAITNNVRYLHKWLWKQDVPATDPEVQRTVQLFTDVWNDAANAPATSVACSFNNGNDKLYTGRAWAAVLAYMLGDPQFLYE